MKHKYIPASVARKYPSDLTAETLIMDQLWEAKQTGNERSIAVARERVRFNYLEQAYQHAFDDTF